MNSWMQQTLWFDPCYVKKQPNTFRKQNNGRDSSASNKKSPKLDPKQDHAFKLGMILLI